MTYLYAFDFDYTLIDADSSTAWCHYLYEPGIVHEPQFLQREAELMAQYDAGTMRVEDYIAFSMGALRHLPVTEIDAICQDYVQTADGAQAPCLSSSAPADQQLKGRGGPSRGHFR